MPTKKTKKQPAKKAAKAKKVVRKSAAKKPIAKKKAPAKKAPAKKAAKKAVAKNAAKKVVAKKAAPKKSPAKKKAAAKPKAAPKPPSSSADTTADGHAFGTIEQTEHFSAAPQRVYDALTSGKLHSAFTGAEARITPKKGGEFHAWGGQFKGKFLELTPGEKIVQTWRSKDFPAGYPDSHLEISLVPESGGTRLELKHTKVPYKKLEEYHGDWSTLYWTRLRAWLATHAE